jgi:uncharacterized protein (DUF2132 family)
MSDQPVDPPEAEKPKAQPKQARNPLHGLTLEAIVTALADHYGWEELGQRIPVRCFNVDPSVGSSLRFLRKTPWAREKVEGLYLFMLRERSRAAGRQIRRGACRRPVVCEPRQGLPAGHGGIALSVERCVFGGGSGKPALRCSPGCGTSNRVGGSPLFCDLPCSIPWT